MSDIWNEFLRLTWRNPPFMALAIGLLWFVPGILFRGMAEKKIIKEKEDKRKEKISRLYPPISKDGNQK